MYLESLCFLTNEKLTEAEINEESVFFVSAGVLRDVTTHFIVDGRSLSKLGGNHVKVRIINPSGSNTDAYITDKGDGTFRVEYTAFEDGRSLRPPHSRPSRCIIKINKPAAVRREDLMSAPADHSARNH